MTTDPRLVALRDIFRSWRETHCTKCGRPLASDADWKTFEEGEGEHLCWDGSDTCNLVMDADLSFAAEVEAHVQTRIAEALDEAADEWRRIRDLFGEATMNPLDDEAKGLADGGKAALDDVITWLRDRAAAHRTGEGTDDE